MIHRYDEVDRDILTIEPVTIARTEEFHYRPPAATTTAKRILLEPDLGYPISLSVAVLQKAIEGIVESDGHGRSIPPRKTRRSDRSPPLYWVRTKAKGNDR